VDYLWSPWRYRYLTTTPQHDGCVFCHIAASQADEENLIVFRGKYNFVVLNKFPYTSGHVMVVPYAHASELSAIAEEAAAEMMALARTTERILREAYRPDGLNIGMNVGSAAGAGIAGHIHLHVLPRWSGDANFMTTIGETRVLPEDLSATWQRLSGAFASNGAASNG
jgi:ATP adenylyltransferase